MPEIVLGGGSLRDLLGSLAKGEGEGEGNSKRPIPEAQVMTLRENFERYAAGCPFKPGDLVTPRKGHNVKWAGEPHIVLEVLDQPIRNFEITADNDPHSSGYGHRIDVRVALISNDGTITTFWQESWSLEPYTGEGA